MMISTMWLQRSLEINNSGLNNTVLQYDEEWEREDSFLAFIVRVITTIFKFA